jgi:hypothetical protein|tara:strand:+ start:615 stop:983 length:369 start_codon:yes stop_codon:yes gene_type:complete
MTKPLGQLSKTEKSEKPEKKETYWTSTEKESLKETYGTEILVENGSSSDVMTKEAPTDASIVTYTVDGIEHQDLTRGSRVKLFDMYYDKFTNVKRIDYGQGTIKPSLWGYSSEAAPKKKKRK